MISTNYSINSERKTPEMNEKFREQAEEILNIGKRRDFLNKKGFSEVDTPFNILNTLIIPSQVFFNDILIKFQLLLCCLHVMDLGTYERLMLLTQFFLNSDGMIFDIKCLQLILIGLSIRHVVFQSSILRVDTSHRVRKITHSKATLNGDDVALLMKDICLLIRFFVQKDTLKPLYFEHLKNLSKQNRDQLNDVGFNINNEEQGIYI